MSLKSELNKKVFDRKVAMCRKLSAENKGKCNWGNCQECGVLPLLIKLHKGILLEESKEIKKEKVKLLK